MNDYIISSKLKKRVVAVAVASCLTFAPWLAQAAGLGKITILSGLGQPLRAELEINASREELVGMSARLAPQDAFKQAGIDYSSVLMDLRLALDKRPDGKQVVKITSAKPVNEPFLDFLVELNWSSGRLVREYTFLLDPPEILVKSAGRPVSVAEAKVVQILPGGGAMPESVPAKPAVRPMPAATPAPAAASTPAPAPTPAPAASAAPAPKVEAEPTKADSGDTRLVKTGDTLGKVAAATQHQGVSLEQMLVGLYKNNPDAFIGKNLNRLKSGAILNIPDKATVEAIPEAEAKKIYLAQSGDWNAYRQKVAAAAAAGPARDDAANQLTSGKITAKVEEKALPAEQGKDQVKVSRSELAGKPAASTGFAEEDRIAKEKALKEAQDRLSLLEKNINELQKLVELKNQKLAELQQQTASKAEAAKPVMPVEPKVEVKAPEAPKAVEPAKPVPEEVKPAKPVEAAPSEAPKPPAPKPAAVTKPLPPPEVQPDFIETLLDDPVPLAGGGGILALLLGYFLYKRRRSEAPAETTAAGLTPSSLGQNSVFRMTGGQNVDTSNTAPHSGDFSQTGPGTIDTDEVDPVAEADVYMAYGRDEQAEEILLEALQKDPQRTAIHAKLLEIYANRNSLKQFETLASELYAQTAGVGPEWEKVAALGARLDPANPLYSGAAAPGRTPLPVFDTEAMVASTPAASEMTFELPAVAETVDTDSFSDSNFVSTVVKDGVDAGDANVSALPDDDHVAIDDLMGLDFDLGASVIAPLSVSAPPEAPMPAEEELSAEALDFDLGMTAVPVAAQEPEPEPVKAAPAFSPEGTLVVPRSMDLMTETYGVEELTASEPDQLEAEMPALSMVDFELDLGKEIAEAPPSPAALPEEVAAPLPEMADVDTDALEFDMTLTDSTVLGQPMAPPSFDIGSINLDLSTEQDVTELPAPELDTILSPDLPEALAPVADAAVDDAVREEITTKLDLAKAYEEMGDLEGARELLGEVAAEGPPDLAGEAKDILARIGS